MGPLFFPIFFKRKNHGGSPHILFPLLFAPTFRGKPWFFSLFLPPTKFSKGTAFLLANFCPPPLFFSQRSFPGGGNRLKTIKGALPFGKLLPFKPQKPFWGGEGTPAPGFKKKNFFFLAPNQFFLYPHWFFPPKKKPKGFFFSWGGAPKGVVGNHKIPKKKTRGGGFFGIFIFFSRRSGGGFQLGKNIGGFFFFPPFFFSGGPFPTYPFFFTTRGGGGGRAFNPNFFPIFVKNRRLFYQF